MNKISDLQHVTQAIPGSGKVVVLNTGALIDPEAEAMLQALHSRSVGGIDAHLEVLAERGAEKFMETFYVGYGHQSIGDCGSATIFIEGVSMLAAKAIQDWRLYSGQEASTRYVDFGSQEFADPLGTLPSSELLETWRGFYLYGLGELVPLLMERYPRGEGEKEAIWKKAIKARAFDIMRGFLPAGATTNLAWHTNLRQAADKLMVLRHHPLLEVGHIAYALEEALKRAFPSSFGHKRYDKTEDYNRWWMAQHLFNPSTASDFAFFPEGIDLKLLREYQNAMNRPPKTPLPPEIAWHSTIRVPA